MIQLLLPALRSFFEAFPALLPVFLYRKVLWWEASSLNQAEPCLQVFECILCHAVSVNNIDTILALHSGERDEK